MIKILFAKCLEDRHHSEHLLFCEASSTLKAVVKGHLHNEIHLHTSCCFQLLSSVPLFETPMDFSMPGSSVLISLSLLKSTEWVMLSNYIILCSSLLHLPSIFPNIRVFSNESGLCIRWPVAQIQDTDNTKCWQAYGAIGILRHCLEATKWYSHFGTQCGVNHKITQTLTILSSNYIFW